MGLADNKVAFISGVARGQGRSHAVRLAEEGADIIGFDICANDDAVEYPLATPEDLEETAEFIGKFGRKAVLRVADVRDYDAVKQVVDGGVAELGRLDIVLANAGVMAITGRSGCSGRLISPGSTSCSTVCSTPSTSPSRTCGRAGAADRS